jgi:hypothetical protein
MQHTQQVPAINMTPQGYSNSFSHAVKAFPGLPIMLIMPSMIKVLAAERRTYSSWFFLQQPVPVPQIHPLSFDSSHKICGHLM